MTFATVSGTGATDGQASGLAEALLQAGRLAGARRAFEELCACRPRLALPGLRAVWIHLVPAEAVPQRAPEPDTPRPVATVHGVGTVGNFERLWAVFGAPEPSGVAPWIDVPTALVPLLGPQLTPMPRACEPETPGFCAEIAVSVDGVAHAVRTGARLEATLAGWSVLLRSADWTLGATPAAPLPAPLDVLLDRMRLRPGELRQLRVGDLLLPRLEAYAAAGTVRVLGRELELAATCIFGPGPDDTCVDIDAAADAGRDTAAICGDASAGALSDSLDIVLGRAGIGLGALLAEGVGGQALRVAHEHPYVKLKSGGNTLGVGELVALEHGLAVEVLRIGGAV